MLDRFMTKPHWSTHLDLAKNRRCFLERLAVFDELVEFELFLGRRFLQTFEPDRVNGERALQQPEDAAYMATRDNRDAFDRIEMVGE